MRPALALLALAVPAACFVAPQRRLAARPLSAEEKADFDPNAKVAQLDEVLIQWGIKDDPRIPEECRVDPMTRIKEAGKAGVAAYTLTEFAFWLGSVPLAIALVAYTTGSLPTSPRRKARAPWSVWTDLRHTHQHRVIVPLRIAAALALARGASAAAPRPQTLTSAAKVPDERGRSIGASEVWVPLGRPARSPLRVATGSATPQTVGARRALDRLGAACVERETSKILEGEAGLPGC